MATPAFDWNDIPLLLELARAGSMSAASRKLGIDTSTMSRRLAAVEGALQTRLFIRGNLGYQPTEAGQVFIQHAEVAYGEVQSMLLATRAEADGISGPVRITAVSVLFDHWLVDHLPGLLEQHPQLQIKLIAGDRNLSFTRREADFALRMAQPTEDAALLMRHVGSVGFAAYAALKFASVPRARWGEQPWLAYSDELAQVPEMQWLSQLGPQRTLYASSVTTLVRACEAGLGMALLPCVVGDGTALKRLSAEPEVRRDIWLLSHRDAGKIRRFRVVGDWLAGLFAAEGKRLAG